MNNTYYTLHIEDMNCGGCVSSIQEALEGIEDVSNINIELASKTAAFESGVALDSVLAILKDAGYEGTVVSS
jgi:copper chaperone CopZ